MQVCYLFVHMPIYRLCYHGLQDHYPSQRSICDFGLVIGSRFIAFSGARDFLFSRPTGSPRLPLRDRLDTADT